MRNPERKITMGRYLRPILALSVVLSPLVTTLDGGKPIDFGPVWVELTGDVTGEDGENPLGGPRQSFNAQFRSGKEDKVEIILRKFKVAHPFAREHDFFPGQYSDPDGEACFGEDACNVAAAGLRLFEDGSATFSAYRTCLTADGEDLQDYHFFLEGSWLGGGLAELRDVLTAVGGHSFTAAFDQMEITADGKKHNRRKSCRGTFADGAGSDFTQVTAHVTF